jgi:translation initiation factor IF-3
MDYRKFLYNQKKKEKELKAKQSKVEIKEIKSTKAAPMIEIKIKEDKKTVETKTEESPKQLVEKKTEKKKQSPIQQLLNTVNEEVKKIKSDGKLSKEEKKELIKNLLSNSL